MESKRPSGGHKKLTFRYSSRLSRRPRSGLRKLWMKLAVLAYRRVLNTLGPFVPKQGYGGLRIGAALPLAAAFPQVVAGRPGSRTQRRPLGSDGPRPCTTSSDGARGRRFSIVSGLGLSIPSCRSPRLSGTGLHMIDSSPERTAPWFFLSEPGSSLTCCTQSPRGVG